MLSFALSHWLVKLQQVVVLAEAAAKNQPADTTTQMCDEPVLSVTCAFVSILSSNALIPPCCSFSDSK